MSPFNPLRTRIRWSGWIGLLLAISFLYVGCSDDKQGLSFSYPQQTSVRWQYDILHYFNGDTTNLGSIEVHTAEFGQHERQQDVYITRLVRRLDSLSGTQRDSTIQRTYYYADGKYNLEMYAGSFYRIFDTMLGSTVLDSIAAQDPAGEEYQYFYEYVPGWIKIASFQENAATPYNVHPQQTFYLNFRHRDTQISGSVDIESKGVFWGFDTINLPMQDSVDTYLIKNTMYFDYDLKRDTVDIQPFRETMDWWFWVHPSKGIVQRDRKPFTLTVPGVPSRGPLIHVDGERWVLTGLKGLTIQED